MAGTFNSITLIGHLSRDPESRFLPDGTQVASFSVATSERWRDKSGQQQERTTWFRVSAFGKLGETCNQYLHKGSYVYLEGPLSQQEYTDREGNKRTSLEVRAREMRLLDKVGEGVAQPASPSGADADQWTAGDAPAQPADASDGATGSGAARSGRRSSRPQTPSANVDDSDDSDDSDEIPF